MFSTFLYAFEAVIPLVLLIFVGYMLRRIGIFTEEFLSKAYSFAFRVALPCMLFCNVYSIESIGRIDFRTVLYACLMVVALFFLGVLAAFLFIPDKRQRGVVVQCFFRSNSAVIGVSLTEALGGAAALQCISVLTAFTIPLYNVLAVIALTAFTGDGTEGAHGLRAINWRRIGRKIVTNPLIIGVGLGLLCLAVRHFIPVNDAGEKVFLLARQGKVLYTAVQNLGKIASPFMMLILGGQFTFSAVKTMKKQIAVGVVGRILLAPCLAIGLGYLLSRLGVLTLGAPEYASFIALYASPVAVSSAIMAREMENDDALAGQFVVWTSLGSLLSVFLFAMAFRTLGFL